MRTARLENWSVVNTSGPYTAPEISRYALHGVIYDDANKRFVDGTVISTSMLTSISYKGASATTRSGSEYTLGTPDPHFVVFLEGIGRSIDEYEVVADETR
jgi:hypothetical protein